MTLSEDTLKTMLLDMLASARVVEPCVTGRLRETDWLRLTQIAQQHRVVPMLHAQAKRNGAAWGVPHDVAARWSAAYQRSAMKLLAQQALLLQLDQLMSAAAISYAALKGAGLAWHVYPDPAIRPMRDIDILVAPEDAVRAFKALLAAGFVQDEACSVSLDAAIAEHKHLPALAAPHSAFSVEIHCRLQNHHFVDADASRFDDAARLLSGRVWRTVAGRPIPFLSDTDALLHLIHHAVYEHRFNNGPLIFNDIALFVPRSAVDWSQFWDVAERCGWARGCQLLFDLTACFHGRECLGDQPRVEATPRDVMHQAALLTLQDYEHRVAVAAWSEMLSVGSVPKMAALLARKLRPKPFILSAFNHTPGGAKRAWWHYPRWLYARLFGRLANAMRPQMRAEIRRGAGLAAWLQD